ncbi:polysaccharide deacetylase family protein [Anaerosolibacter sp.]|uniref:polysaccharide deacetylase family protein n=1 Tax=Anaerosolibacter sp. TaxID=1872527 RepID=UPI0039EFEE18
MKRINKYIVLYMMIMGFVWFIQFEMVEEKVQAADVQGETPISSAIISSAEGQDNSPALEELDGAPTNGEEIDQIQTNSENRISYSIKNHVLYKGGGQASKIALTFDDGPDPYYTGKVLDILKEHEVKATFFLIGTHIEKYPDVVARIAEEGHGIGNHSWGHKKFTWLSPTDIQSELEKTGDLIDSITGYHYNIFRPPFGTMNKKTLELVNAAGYNVVNWSVDTKDWSGTPVSKILYYVKMQLKPGGIILMHSSGRKQAMENMLASLPQIIQLAKEKGYVFVTVPEVLDLEEDTVINVEERKQGE